VLVERNDIEKRVQDALAAAPPRIPVIVGRCGTGRTTMLYRLIKLLGSETEHLDIERIATTPEGFLASVSEPSHLQVPKSFLPDAGNSSAKTAFEQVCVFFEHARKANDRKVIFLLDEALDLRVFESFPGLRDALSRFLRTLCTSNNRFVITTRFTTRALRVFGNEPERFEIIHLPPFTLTQTTLALKDLNLAQPEKERLEMAGTIHALTDGHPLYVRLLAQGANELGGNDPISALTAQLAPGAPLSMACRFSYQLRLNRARGYGALGGILRILSKEEPLTLTEIAHRMHRTPGSTKDYLSWLEDVDLIQVQHKRYRFTDPLLRLWLDLHGRATPPNPDDLSQAVRDYAAERLPYAAPPTPPTEPRPKDQRSRTRSRNIIEID
tara:strand:+ start:6645 stop:7793 length:1149 start_codon:yes stop_codon:yes gene_type:complete